MNSIIMLLRYTLIKVLQYNELLWCYYFGNYVYLPHYYMFILTHLLTVTKLLLIILFTFYNKLFPEKRTI